MLNRVLVISIIFVILLTSGVYFFVNYRPSSFRAAQVFAWIKAPGSRTDIVIAAGSRCGNAPFIFPTTGVVGYLWDDFFN